MADDGDDAEGIAEYYTERLKKESDPPKRIRLLRKIRGLKIPLETLQAVGMIKLVSGLRKCDGEVSNVANEVVGHWKQIASRSDKSKSERLPSTDVYKSRASDYVSERKGSVVAATGGVKNAVHQNSSSKSSVGRQESSSVSSHCGNSSKKSNSLSKTGRHDEKAHIISSKDKTKVVTKHSTIPDQSAIRGEDIRHHRKVDKGTSKSACASNSDGAYKSRDTSSKTSSHKSATTDSHGARQASSHRHAASAQSTRIENSNETSTSTGKKRSRTCVNGDSDGFNASVASFEDALGFNDSPSVKKKKVNAAVAKPKIKVEPTFSYAEQEIAPPLIDYNATSTLSEIQPFYKPMRYTILDSPVKKKHFGNSETDKGNFVITSRHNRTQVFSGRRTQYLTEVPSLYNACIKVLQENICELSWLGGVPYSVLEQVLKRCTPEQLYTLEDYNPYLLEDTDILWMKHCENKFKGKERQELETWRELYLRLQDEREAKLKCVTANISASMAKAIPIRKTKLAYLDCEAKPPRNVARKQARFGTGQPVAVSSAARNSNKQLVRPSGTSSAASAADSVPIVLVPAVPALQQQQPQKVVKKVAPLMQKTIKFMKNRFRR